VALMMNAALEMFSNAAWTARSCSRDRANHPFAFSNDLIFQTSLR
jgi:hypothetical protein